MGLRDEVKRHVVLYDGRTCRTDVDRSGRECMYWIDKVDERGCDGRLEGWKWKVGRLEEEVQVKEKKREAVQGRQEGK